LNRKESEFQKTFADLLVQVAGPALIMALVGSLVFFIFTVLYQGDYPFRVYWVFGLFIFAAVLISRISIEEGLERAAFYGIGLAAATFFVANFFLTIEGPLAPFSWFVNAGIIALIWWSASRLTWDITVNDDSRDTSAQGLVELFRRNVKSSVDLNNQTDEDQSDSTDDQTDDNENLLSVQDSATEQAEEDLTNATWDKKILQMWPFKRKKNTPGLWIFYFSIAAFPIFGFGQAFIPATRLADRRFAFLLFVIYIGAALGLLSMTSLMSLQRYLRKRNTALPDSIAKTWMIIGTVFAIAVLSIVWLLPRPMPEYSITQAVPSFFTKDRKTSKWGWGNDGKKKSETEGNRTESNDNAKKTQSKKGSKNDGGQAEGGQQSKKGGKSSGQKGSPGKKSDSKSGQKSSGNKTKGAKTKGAKSKGDKSSSKNKSGDKSKSSDKSKSGDQTKSGDKSKQGDQKSDNPSKTDPIKKNNQKQNQSKGGKSQSKSPNKSQNKSKSSSVKSSRPRDPSSSSPPPPPAGPPQPGIGFLATMIKWITIVVILILIIFIAIKYHKELLAALRSFLEELKHLFANLFGRKQKKSASADETAAPIAVPTKPFHEFGDPFQTGNYKKMSAEQLVAYTFEAFQAWGNLRGYPRNSDQTPHEYSKIIARVQKAIPRSQSDELANLLCQSLYGPTSFQLDDVRPLQNFWQTMKANAAAPAIPAQVAPA
jgi:hypothetical protein